MSKSKNFMPLILGGIILAVGILFCFEARLGVQIISYIVGAALIVIGLIYAIESALKDRSTLNAGVIAASLYIALGITVIWQNLASVLLALLPILLIVLGSVILIDAFLYFFVRKGSVLWFVVELIIAAVLIALGICILTIAEVRNVASIIFGVVLIILAIYIIVTYFTSSGKKKEK
ncbi:MAG: hypothetical protein J6U25_03270 [Clostridia bacterium]|nr:hypothetical protein [Clostridia bacterium]